MPTARDIAQALRVPRSGVETFERGRVVQTAPFSTEPRPVERPSLARQLLGPHVMELAEPAKALAFLLGETSDAADMRDMTLGPGNMGRALLNRDPAGALAGFTQTVGGGVGLAAGPLFGGLGALPKVAAEGADALRKALAPAPPFLRKGQRIAWDRVPDEAERVRKLAEERIGVPFRIVPTESNFGRSYYVKPVNQPEFDRPFEIRISDHDANLRTYTQEGRVTLVSPGGDMLRSQAEIDSRINDAIEQGRQYLSGKKLIPDPFAQIEGPP